MQGRGTPQPAMPGVPAPPTTPGRATGRGTVPAKEGPPTPCPATSGRGISPSGGSAGRATPINTPRTPGGPPPSTPTPRGRASGTAGPPAGPPHGRAALRPAFRSETASSLAAPTTSDTISSAVESLQLGTGGSGSLTERESGSGAPRGQHDSGFGRGATRGRMDQRREILKTRPSQITSKKGTLGSTNQLLTNHFQMEFARDWVLKQYRVDYGPDEDHLGLRKALLHQHAAQLGKYVFDGTVIYTPQTYSDPMELTSKSREDQIYSLTVRMVGEVSPDDYQYLHVMNIILRKCLEGLDLQLLGRNYFDPKAGVKLGQYKLEIWPGYMTSIRQHEQSVLVCCDSGVKIIRTDTALDEMKRIRDKGSMLKRLLGSIVITRYNNETYRVDDIDFNTTVKDTFKRKDGSEVSFKDYFFSKYKLKITDDRQPLLVSNPKPRDIRGGRTHPALLIPELCYMTGLGEEHQSDRVKQALAQHIRPIPDQRIETLLKFTKRMNGTEAVAKELAGWNMKMSSSILRIPARLFPPESIKQGENRPPVSYGVDDADWGRSFRNFKMLKSVNLSKWAVVAPLEMKDLVEAFVPMLPKVGAGLGFGISQPLITYLPNKLQSTYVAKLQELAQKKPGLIMVVIESDDVYKAVKKTLYVENAIPSQVMRKATLTKSKGLMSIATKVAIQMAAKLGAEPWGVVSMPKDTMVVGYDSYHDTASKGKSVGAVVASLNNDMTRYTSSCEFHANNEELLDHMRGSFFKAIQAYKAANGNLPSRIIVYRDGVGDGQIEYVKEGEITGIKAVFEQFNFNPKLTFVIVSKRINARFFKPLAQGKATNPPSGTIIDDVVTLPERYDFFLISQSVRQGTVNPTSYNVIQDESGWSPDNLQRLTYKLCHLYFNWPGTVRVPAPCQYAHKMAYLVGESIHKAPNPQLANLLYYLYELVSRRETSAEWGDDI
eukprot:maker-scaffold150_size309978-snap-gene-1.13 protein:Tk09109 transcript:maker-scaffold150_size309978-snap-gene-1.13-mRNA-1 annotation:"giwi protein"